MRTTRDAKKAIRTAKVALAAGKFDTARRAVAYAMSATGLRDRLPMAPSADPVALAIYLRALTAEVARRDLEAQRARSLFVVR